MRRHKKTSASEVISVSKDLNFPPSGTRRSSNSRGLFPFPLDTVTIKDVQRNFHLGLGVFLRHQLNLHRKSTLPSQNPHSSSVASPAQVSHSTKPIRRPGNDEIEGGYGVPHLLHLLESTHYPDSLRRSSHQDFLHPRHLQKLVAPRQFSSLSPELHT